MAESLAHSKWVCKYHIVFSPKYRRKIIYNQLRADIQQYIRDLCKWKGVEILEGHMMPDHVHLLLSIPPKYCVFSFMGYLKGKSSLMIYEKYPELKYKYRNREFWCRGYYVETVGKNAREGRKGNNYVRNCRSDRLRAGYAQNERRHDEIERRIRTKEHQDAVIQHQTELMRIAVYISAFLQHGAVAEPERLCGIED